MSDAHTVHLTVPALLLYRDLAMRVVMESCKLVGGIGPTGDDQATDDNGAPRVLSDRFEFDDQFTMAFSSAFSEIFNNIVLHAYEGRDDGTIELIATIDNRCLTVDLVDSGNSFNIDAVPALEDPLPVGGMGIHIARTMLDSLIYEPGPPNRWRLIKHLAQPSEQAPTSSESRAE